VKTARSQSSDASGSESTVLAHYSAFIAACSILVLATAVVSERPRGTL
jgi:hypothetical protein